MSFVHCPGCRRAYDLRRGASCPRCASAAVAKPAERPEPGPRPVDERIAELVAELARLVDSASSTELSAAQRKLAALRLPALGAARWLSRPGEVARLERAAGAAREVLRLTEQVSSKVSRAVSGSRRLTGAVVRGLRATLSP